MASAMRAMTSGRRPSLTLGIDSMSAMRKFYHVHPNRTAGALCRANWSAEGLVSGTSSAHNRTRLHRESPAVTIDPIHAQSHANPLGSELDREARVEELLLSGLDHYFAGQHDLAINVWTRALFIDRGHPRARAYIERARRALAERQREGEELIHTG